MTKMPKKTKKIICLWKDCSTNEGGKSEMPSICQKMRCNGVFNSKKEAKEFCKYFIDAGNTEEVIDKAINEFEQFKPKQ